MTQQTQRVERLQVSLTPAEHRIVTRAAELERIPLAVYVRRAALLAAEQAAGRRPALEPAPMPALKGGLGADE